jgi:two-component system, NarL family, sensor kinase
LPVQINFHLYAGKCAGGVCIVLYLKNNLLCVKCFYCIVLFVAASAHLTGQSKNRDSLFRELAKAKIDSNKALIYLHIGYDYERNQPDSAIYYYNACNELSKQLHFNIGQLRYFACYTELLDQQNKFDQSLALNAQALELAKKIHNPTRIAGVYNNTAVTYFHLRNYEKCVANYLMAKTIFEELKDEPHLAVIFSNLAQVYAAMKQKNDLAYAYGVKAINISRNGNDEYTEEEALVNTSRVLIELHKYDSSLVLLRQTIKLGKKLKDNLSQINALVAMNDVNLVRGQYDEIEKNATEMAALATPIGNKEGIAQSMFYLSKYQFHEKKYALAKKTAAAALAIARDNKLNNIIGKIYLLLSDAALTLGDQQGYQVYRQSSDSMQEVILSDKILKNTQELDAQYSLTIKQSEINNLNNEKKIQKLTLNQNHTIITALGVSLIILSFSGLLFATNTQQKKKLLITNTLLQQQKIAELEKEKQLLAADAVLQGQEEERSRLARDLHDGLGSILSSAKYSFNNMKNNFIITGETAAAFDKSMAMLDRSISELRAVSHNMMPEALMTFGLDTALRDYCNSINQSGAVQLMYQSFDLNDDSIAKTTASVIYRIIQELVNNILKHAHAGTALVQLVRKNESLSITVEDDGRGFETSQLENSDGIGLKNLRNRVTYLKGTIDLNTNTGKGVSINIEIPTIA